MNIKSVEHEAMQLPANDRAKLALELIESLDELGTDEVQGLWLAESERRAAQVDGAEIGLISGEVVAAEARALLRQ